MCRAEPWWGISRDLLAEAERRSKFKDFRSRHYHEMQHCMHCRKSRSTNPGLKLQHCAACRLAQYCSRECQRADRPHHQEMCERNAALRQENLKHRVAVRYGRVSDPPANLAELLDMLQGWLTRWRAFIYDLLPSALRLHQDRNAHLHQLLDLHLEWVSEASSISKRFKVTSAQVRRIADVDFQTSMAIAQNRESIAPHYADDPNALGVAFIRLVCANLEPQNPDILMVLLEKTLLDAAGDPNWKERLMNEVGIEEDELSLVD